MDSVRVQAHGGVGRHGKATRGASPAGPCAVHGSSCRLGLNAVRHGRVLTCILYMPREDVQVLTRTVGCACVVWPTDAAGNGIRRVEDLPVCGAKSASTLFVLGVQVKRAQPNGQDRRLRMIMLGSQQQWEAH